jgi:hypothetical protein
MSWWRLLPSRMHREMGVPVTVSYGAHQVLEQVRAKEHSKERARVHEVYVQTLGAMSIIPRSQLGIAQHLQRQTAGWQHAAELVKRRLCGMHCLKRRLRTWTARCNSTQSRASCGGWGKSRTSVGGATLVLGMPRPAAGNGHGHWDLQGSCLMDGSVMGQVCRTGEAY